MLADVKTVDSFAFAYASNLKGLEIPVGLTAIKEDAFAECKVFADVYYGGTQANWSSVAVTPDGNTKFTSATVRYYVEKTYWVDGDSVLEEIAGTDGGFEYVEQTKVSLSADEDVIVEEEIEIPAANSVIISCTDVVKNFIITAKNTSRRNVAQIKVYASVAVNGGEYVWVEISDIIDLTPGEATYSFAMNKPEYKHFKIENISENAATVAYFTMGMYSA